MPFQQQQAAHQHLRLQQLYLCMFAGIAHLMSSLRAEGSSKTVGVHTLSPGMVLTDLLLEGATLENKQIFNILCEQVCIFIHHE